MNAGTNAWSAYATAQGETGAPTVWPTAPPPPTGASGETSTEGGGGADRNNVGTSGGESAANPNMVS